ncbi:MFS general substrate transporter [Aaosphaeria arxii CBS 175.79]|uniref:MFS general substrate transporter n=1 Tax=Aaosphaeria arxii CBS 175.79 TaxID=1450172 RepID=A0A6A5Y6F5_9PLEO|nr:MFS general substrate transporter [Aaosphaeria arxii CBS 175.79]KAF2020390.1 MFS general substrate transporter [Aaosphaeria arxii CBS 175.79]
MTHASNMLDGKHDANIDHVEELKMPSGTGENHIGGNALLVHEDGAVRKIPVPSSNPNDPLNFRGWEKIGIIFCCCWFSIMGLAMASGLGAILNVFFEMYMPQGYNAEQIVFLLTMPSLCIGLGNYIILPLALAYGRRPVFLVSMVVLLAATIAAAVQNSYNGHLTARIIQGLATGASESLLPLMLTEVTFLHERGRVFGLYWTIQNILSSTINLASSYINHDLGWRWYYWIFVITVAVGLVIAFFFGFETQFARPAASVDGLLVFTDEYGVTNIIPDSEAQDYLARMCREGMELPTTGDTGSDVPRKTYAQKLRPWSDVQKQPVKIMLLTYLHMLQSMTSPGIIYAILTSSVALGCGIGISLTYNEVLMVNYGWKPQNVGLINIGGVVGALLGMLYCNLLGDKFVLFAARRNKGIHKPEHQLLTLIPPAIIGVAMLLLYGFTAGGGVTWWAPYLGWTFFQYTFTAVVIVSTTFASEATVQNPGPALVVVVGTKNIVSFGVAYGLTPMIHDHGYKWAFGVLAGIFAGIFLLGIPVYYLNPKWRARQHIKKA